MSRRAAGLRAWVLQRITAVYLGLFIIYLGAHLLFSPPASHEQWRLWVADPRISITLLLFFISLLLHAWVGIRNVLIDYLHLFAVRITLLTAAGLGLAACAVWVTQVVMLARVA